MARLEVNPWFQHDLATEGYRSVVRQALMVGREQYTTPIPCEGPNGGCGGCAFLRPRIGTYHCMDCGYMPNHDTYAGGFANVYR